MPDLTPPERSDPDLETLAVTDPPPAPRRPKVDPALVARRAVEHDLGVIESYLQHMKGAAPTMIFAAEGLARMLGLRDEPGHNDAFTTLTPAFTGEIAAQLRQAARLVELAHEQLTPLFFRYNPGFKQEDGYRYRAPNL
jgi:hypothetical protein